MDMRALQLMIQNQAMTTMASDNHSFSYHSPLMDMTFKQLLQDKIKQASVLNSVEAQPVHKNMELQHEPVSPPIYTNIAGSSINDFIKNSASKYDLDEKLIHSIIKFESNYNTNARSSAGAQGLMQLMPNTAKALGVMNAFDAKQNIEGGAKYLSQMLKRYNGNVKLALAAYNAGPGNVDKHQGVPPFKETQQYVQKVMDHFYT